MRMLALAVLLLSSLSACAPRAPADEESSSRPLSDSAFAELQHRGHAAMGVDQYTSTHRFDDLPDGGRIELQQDGEDAAGVETIRQHLQHIARAFKAGDFSDPTFVHHRQMPGTQVMRSKKDVITYTYAPLPRGGEVRITTTDSEVVRAIHAFMSAQRGEHRSGGDIHH